MVGYDVYYPITEDMEDDSNEGTLDVFADATDDAVQRSSEEGDDVEDVG